MQYDYPEILIQSLVQHGIARADVALVHRRALDVTAHCYVEWRFEAETTRATLAGEEPCHTHYSTLSQFENSVADLEHRAAERGPLQEKFVHGALAARAGMFAQPPRTTVGNTRVSVYIDCADCKGKSTLICGRCEGAGEYQCWSCLGTRRHSDGRPCTWCNVFGKVPCLDCGTNGYHHCRSCQKTGHMTRVAEIDVVATRHLSVQAGHELLERYLYEILPTEQFATMMQLVSQRADGQGGGIYTFNASVIELTLRVKDRDYSMTLLTREGAWIAMSAAWILDDLLAPVLGQLKLLVDDLDKGSAQIIDRFVHCMESPILKAVLGDLQRTRQTNEQVASHIKSRCDLFISNECAQQVARLCNHASDSVAPTVSKKAYARPQAIAAVIVFVLTGLLAEHGFTLFGDGWLARGGTFIGGGIIALLVTAFAVIRSQDLSKKRCMTVQSVLPSSLHRKHDDDAVERAIQKTLADAWFVGLLLGLGCAFFDIAPMTSTLAFSLSSVDGLISFIGQYLY